MGQWNGYITIPPELMNTNLNMNDIIAVHGGITGGAANEIGFDTAHFTDIVPFTEILSKIMGKKNVIKISEKLCKYWTYELVVEECEKVVSQLVKIMEGITPTL
jgi:hypothetical protein